MDQNLLRTSKNSLLRAHCLCSGIRFKAIIRQDGWIDQALFVAVVILPHHFEQESRLRQNFNESWTVLKCVNLTKFRLDISLCLCRLTQDSL